MSFLYILLFATTVSLANSLQCYSGSQLQILDCPSLSCIKQTLGLDTVRYCDGSGVASVCETYRTFETCKMIPNLGFICCCSGNLCNSGHVPFSLLSFLFPTILFVLLPLLV
ncbi:unnamed protein product [Auanema sp. JU1783]|nr:unnamed protein product [Auanema sp. JU1783]